MNVMRPDDAISTHAPLRGATTIHDAIVGEFEFLLTRLCEARPVFSALPVADV